MRRSWDKSRKNTTLAAGFFCFSVQIFEQDLFRLSRRVLGSLVFSRRF
jgi:hypothetical protein